MTVEEAIKELRKICKEREKSCRHVCLIDGCEVEIAIEALKKQIPKKANRTKCPVCGAELFWEGRVLLPTCPCGQKIDWSHA